MVADCRVEQRLMFRPRRPFSVPFVLSLAAIWALAFSAPLFGEARVDGEITAVNALLWDGAADEPGLVGSGVGSIDLRSTRDRNVQARLTLRAILGDVPGITQSQSAGLGAASFSVPRASIRFRLPVTEQYTVRVTAGRDRVSWGTGRLFNAADVIFGPDGTGSADFLEISDDIRDETAWLTAVYFPLGDFAYFEPIVLPPLPELSLSSAESGEEDGGGQGSVDQGGSLDARPLSDTRAGGRFSFEAGRFTFEPAYLYDGPNDRHEIALSSAGLLGIDVYGGARLSLDSGLSSGELIDHTTFSIGGYNRFRLGYDTNLDARLEALIRPGAAWSDAGEPGSIYGLLLYPELILTPGRTFSVVGRSVVSPIDASALTSAGVNWNLFGGFDMLAFVTVQSGGESDTFGWKRPGAVSLLSGFNYRF